jgi:hypothetical protein
MEKTIQFNGVDVTCYEDGSVEWSELKHGNLKRTFGYDTGMGYMKCQIAHLQVRVHRLISMAFDSTYSDSLQVDHINGDKSDNRPTNLRMATSSQNMRGMVRRKTLGKSKYRGVSWSKAKSKWLSMVTIDGNKEFVGLFHVEEEAATARDAVAYANGYFPESMNFGIRNAQNLLLCALAVSK